MGSAGLFLNFLWAMLLVVALAYVAARMLKKIGIGKTSAAHYLEQIDYLPLGPKRGIAIVQVVDKTVCLGVTDQSITLLMELDSTSVTQKARETGALSHEPVTLSQFADEMRKRFFPSGGDQ